MDADETIRVAIADDQRLFAHGLARIIGVQPGMEVVGEAHTGEEAVSLCLDVEPDVVLWVYMGEGDPHPDARAQFIRVTPEGLEPIREMLPAQ